MEAREYLEQINILNDTIDKKIRRIDDLKMSAYSVSAVNIKEKVQTSCDGDIMDLVDKAIDLEKETDRIIDQYYDLKCEARKIINMLTYHIDRQVLIYRYIDGLSVRQTAQKLGITPRGCSKAQKRALNQLDEKLKTTIHTQYIVKC